MCTFVELHQAFRRRKPQRWTCRVARVLSVGWFRLIHDLDTSRCILVWYMFGSGSSRGWNCVRSLLKGSIENWQGICPIVHTLQVSWSQRCKQTPVSTSQAQVMECSFLPFPTISQTLAEALAISMEAPVGNARDAAERTRRKGGDAKVRVPRRRPSSWRRRKEATVGEYLGLLCDPWSSGEPVPGQASSVSRCAGAGQSLFSSPHSSDTGRACVLWFSRSSLSVSSL